MSIPTLPTPRQLEILAAWWATKGSCKRAASVLGIGHQPVMNALYLLRRQESVGSTIELCMRYMDQINAVDLSGVRK